MKPITIPQKFIQKGDLVVIPRHEYELLLRRQPKIIPIVKLSQQEKRSIAKSEKELARGEYITLNKLEYELRGTRAKKH